MRRLQVYTSLWAMQPHDQTGISLPHDQVCEVVAAARPHMDANGLTPLIVAFPKTIDSLEDTLHMAADFAAPFVDVIGQVMPIAIDDMVPVIETWMGMSERIGVPIQFETHRNCITNDHYVTQHLLDRIPQMRI